MTDKQMEYLALYTRGLTVTEIALATGKKKNTVSAVLKKAKGELSRREAQPRGQRCPYSPSCFTCPLRDCAIDPAKAPLMNVI